jgi:hypothetical protein
LLKKYVKWLKNILKNNLKLFYDKYIFLLIFNHLLEFKWPIRNIFKKLICARFLMVEKTLNHAMLYQTPEEICFLIGTYSRFWGYCIKRANCPFCGNRWIRRKDEEPITCPNCGRTFYSPEQLQKRQQE